jgi:transposase
MVHEDARKLSPAAQHERRRQVVRAYKRGRNRARIAEEVGLSYTAVSNTLKRHAEAGMRGLMSGQRGRPVFFGRSLSTGQEDRV